MLCFIITLFRRSRPDSLPFLECRVVRCTIFRTWRLPPLTLKIRTLSRFETKCREITEQRNERKNQQTKCSRKHNNEEQRQRIGHGGTTENQINFFGECARERIHTLTQRRHKIYTFQFLSSLILFVRFGFFFGIGFSWLSFLFCLSNRLAFSVIDIFLILFFEIQCARIFVICTQRSQFTIENFVLLEKFINFGNTKT